MVQSHLMSTTLIRTRLLLKNRRRSKNECAKQHHEEEAVAEVVHLLAAVTHVIFPVAG